jgi:hypothetical protein
MRLDPYQLQILTTLIIVLGVALVALIWDVLHANTEQLRELAQEVRMLREAEAKRSGAKTPRMETRPSRDLDTPSAAGRPVAAPALATPRDSERKRPLAPEALAAMERGAQLAGVGRRSASEPSDANPPSTK